MIAKRRWGIFQMIRLKSKTIWSDNNLTVDDLQDHDKDILLRNTYFVDEPLMIINVKIT
ncbi:MAG: hypothetical protein ACLUIS_01550 [Longibaculum sp.]